METIEACTHEVCTAKPGFDLFANCSNICQKNDHSEPSEQSIHNGKSGFYLITRVAVITFFCDPSNLLSKHYNGNQDLATTRQITFIEIGVYNTFLQKHLCCQSQVAVPHGFEYIPLQTKKDAKPAKVCCHNQRKLKLISFTLWQLGKWSEH